MKVAAIVPHLQQFGGIRRFLEIGNVMVDSGIDYTIYPRKEKECNWFDYRGKIGACSRIEADYVMASYPPDFKILPRVKGKVFIYILAGGIYINMYKQVYKRYPFILNNRVFLKWFPGSHLVEGAVNIHRFKPRIRPKHRKIPRVLYFDKKTKGADYVRGALRGLREIELVPLKGLPDGKLVKTYQSGDFFVSWEERPGWSNTAAEALACGLTVITNGRNCEPFIDKVIVVPCLRSFFLDPENRKIRQRESMYIFSWERTVDRLLEIFHAT